MGLFEIQRQLAAETRGKSELAERASADLGGPDAFLADAWRHVRDPIYVNRLYAARARTDPDAALALARLAHAEPESLHALASEQRPFVAPLVAAGLLADRSRRAAELLVPLGDPQVVPLVLDLAGRTTDERLRLALADVAATWGDDAAGEAAAQWLPASFAPLTATLARRGHPQAAAALTTSLRNFLNEWHKGGRTSSGDWPAPFALVDAIGEARVADAVPLLLAALATPLVVRALLALAKLAAPRAREPARALLRELGGTRRDRTWAYRLAAEQCLAALDEPQTPATAREVLADIRPSPYGYPKLHEALELRALALAALQERGAPEDLEFVATHITSPHRAHRDVAALALTRLGRPAPPLRLLDVPRCEQLLAAGQLVAALADPHAVFTHHAALALVRTADASARAAAREWALAHLERTPNFPTTALDAEVIEPAGEAALDVLAALKDGPLHQPRIAATTSAWARAKLFNDRPAPAPQPSTGTWRASARRLDRAPFVFGKQVLALALDPAAARLAVVGDHLGQIVDAATGAILVELVLEYVWAHDCAFSPDGTALAVAYHGCHVVIFDAATGRRLRTIDGYGGVPDATKRLAFTADGDLLAFAGSDGSARLVRWRTGEEVWHTAPRAGSFEAIAVTPDACLFSHVKVRGGQTNHLLRLDLATLASEQIPMPTSMWSLAQAGGRWYAGGAAKKIRALGPALRPARTGSLDQPEVVRLAATPGGALLALSQTGSLTRWDPATGQPRELIHDTHKLWALAVAPDGAIFTAGTSGVVHRFTADGTRIASGRGEVHTEQITGIAPLPDGSTITAGWDGRLLRWPPEFGAAELLLHNEQRLTCLAVAGATAYAGADERVCVVDLASAIARAIDLQGARAEDLSLAPGLLHVATSTGEVRAFTTADLSRLGAVRVAREATALARTADGTLLVGTDGGLLLELDPAGQVLWSRDEFGRDLIDKDPHGDPHRTVVAIAIHGARFAAAANDDTLRVFDHAGHRRTLRLLTDTGIFNNCEFTPDGRLIGVTASGGLAVFDATTGALLVHLRTDAFPGADELTVFTFTATRRALVGARNGALFEVTLESP
jgi:WD40 repeat protein